MATMLSAAIHRDIAAQLEAAERSRQPIRACSVLHPAATMDDAYAIQAEWMKIKLAAGRRVLGHKIGLTSRAMQINAGIDTPDSGVLLDDMFYRDGDDIPFDRFVMPRIEVELAFMLGADLRGPDCTTEQVLRAADYVVPALEIIDVRFQMKDELTGKPRTVIDTIADNACNAAVVVGSVTAKPDSLDLRWVGAICQQNGVVEETGVAAGVLGHPATGIAWLANRLARYGDYLKRGQFVMAGSFTRPMFIKRGDEFMVEYGPLGTMRCRFR
jgi:2-oxo-hept-3-ene-1,7-dioate hydratase